MESLALTVSIVLLIILVIAFSLGGFIATKTRPFLWTERLGLLVMWSLPFGVLGFVNSTLLVWALIGYYGGTPVFWRKWI